MVDIHVHRINGEEWVSVPLGYDLKSWTDAGYVINKVLNDTVILKAPTRTFIGRPKCGLYKPQ